MQDYKIHAYTKPYQSWLAIVKPRKGPSMADPKLYTGKYVLEEFIELLEGFGKKYDFAIQLGECVPNVSRDYNLIRQNSSGSTEYARLRLRKTGDKKNFRIYVGVEGHDIKDALTQYINTNAKKPVNISPKSEKKLALQTQTYSEKPPRFKILRPTGGLEIITAQDSFFMQHEIKTKMSNILPPNYVLEEMTGRPHNSRTYTIIHDTSILYETMRNKDKKLHPKIEQLATRVFDSIGKVPIATAHLKTSKELKQADSPVFRYVISLSLFENHMATFAESLQISRATIPANVRGNPIGKKILSDAVKKELSDRIEKAVHTIGKPYQLPPEDTEEGLPF